MFDRLWCIEMIGNFRKPCLSLALVAFCLSLLVSCGGGIGGDSDEANGADPGVLEAPIAYIKRPIPTDEDDDDPQPIQVDVRDVRQFTSGGDVYVRDNSTTIATERNITRSVTGGIGDVKGLSASFDGTKLIFSLRLFDENENDDIVPSWNIYEYDLELDELRRVISSDLTAEEGDDLSPAYLPDGRIVFTSSRQKQAVEGLINEGKVPFSRIDETGRSISTVLHVMSSSGNEIRQISFNQTHDLNPVVLSGQFSGQILFSRWDATGGNSRFDLYKVDPDGSNMELLYGAHSHDTGTNGSTIQFTQARETADGDLLVVVKPFQGTFGGGDIFIIDTENFVDNERPVWSMNGFQGPAQTPATANPITSDGSISRNGRYASAFPLLDGSDRVLVSKSICQILVDGEIRPCIEPWISDSTAVEVSPAYGIWIYDIQDQTEKVIVRAEEGVVMTEIIALQARPLPPILSNSLDDTWRDEGVGVINIKSVYDFSDGSGFNGCFLQDCQAVGIASVADLGDPGVAMADQRPARFVRFLKPVAFPDQDDPTLVDPPDLRNTAFGPQLGQSMREIVGYAPVEPDGSVKVKVPADIPLAVDVLDKFGRRIGPRHENWFQVVPGATTTCVGCHTHSTSNNEVPFAHSRSDATAPSINTGIDSGLVFDNTQIPGTNITYYGNLGDTMAEVRFELAGLSVPPAEEPQLSADVTFEDVWTDPLVRAPDTMFEYAYTDLLPPVSSPATAACTPWTAKCRIIINYERDIHPIWQIDRGIVDLNANGVMDDTCTECHRTLDDMNADRVADGQLDLTDGISDLNADRLKSYQELFFSDAGEELDMVGDLVNIQIEVDVLDADGNVIGTEFIDDPAAATSPAMSANGARASYFIEKLTETEIDAGRSLTPASDPNYIDHSGFLEPAELRLISEWLDIGAQNFNDPFDPLAPQN